SSPSLPPPSSRLVPIEPPLLHLAALRGPSSAPPRHPEWVRHFQTHSPDKGPDMTPLRRRMIEDMTLRNFAPRTIRAYLERVATFARFFGPSPERLGPEHIRGYLLHLIQERRASWSCYNQALCALKFLYRVTLRRDWVVDDVVCPKQPRELPVV